MNRNLNRSVDADEPAAPRFTDKQGRRLAFIRAYRRLNRRGLAARSVVCKGMVLL